MRYEDAKVRVGQEYVMMLDTAEVGLVLTACTPGGSDGTFTLELDGGPSVPPQQGTYLLRAAGAEPELVFLVPSSSSASGTTFHAVFNDGGER